VKVLLRRVLGMAIIVSSGPFFIAGGVSRYAYQGIQTHPNYWMLVPGGVLLFLGAWIFGPKSPER
jgi:hypothetical protein